MREIKFRAWLKEDRWNAKKGMSEPFVLGKETYTNDDDGVHYRDKDENTAINDFGLKDYILMQYTGLKDKNGKEIYEGDIVSDFNGERGSVVFSRCVFMVKWANGFPGYPFISETNEVIGNIYENPELLEVK